MGAVYKIQFEIKSDADKANFRKAFSGIFSLSKALRLSNDNKDVRSFITWIEKNYYWLSIDEKSQSVWINAEHSETMALKQGDKFGIIEYDFGKELPGRVEYLGAFMVIISHYFPSAAIGPDAENHLEEFEDGVLLAQLVIKDVKNPLLKDGASLEKDYSPSDEILKICKAVREKCHTMVTLPRPILQGETSAKSTEATPEVKTSGKAPKESKDPTIKIAHGGARKRKKSDSDSDPDNNSGSDNDHKSHPAKRQRKDEPGKEEKTDASPLLQSYMQHGVFAAPLSHSDKVRLREKANQYFKMMFDKIIQEHTQKIFTSTKNPAEQKQLLDTAISFTREQFLAMSRDQHEKIHIEKAEQKINTQQQRERCIEMMETSLAELRNKLIALGDSESMVNKELEGHRAFFMREIDRFFPDKTTNESSEQTTLAS